MIAAVYWKCIFHLPARIEGEKDGEDNTQEFFG